MRAFRTILAVLCVCALRTTPAFAQALDDTLPEPDNRHMEANSFDPNLEVFHLGKLTLSEYLWVRNVAFTCELYWTQPYWPAWERIPQSFPDYVSGTKCEKYLNEWKDYPRVVLHIKDGKHHLYLKYQDNSIIGKIY
jgi:hypothetical protein